MGKEWVLIVHTARKVLEKTEPSTRLYTQQGGVEVDVE